MNTTPSEETIDADWWEGICQWCGEYLHGGEYGGICDGCAFEGADE
jgi:hypothetical protein